MTITSDIIRTLIRQSEVGTVGTSLLCLFFTPVLKFLTYYAQYYAHVKDLCLKIGCFIRV